MKQRLKNPRVGDVVYSLLSGKGVIKSISEELIVLFDNGATKYYTLDGRYRPTHQNSELSYTPWFNDQGNCTASFEKKEVTVVDYETLKQRLSSSDCLPFEMIGHYSGTIKDIKSVAAFIYPRRYIDYIGRLNVLLMIKEFMLIQHGYAKWIPEVCEHYYIPKLDLNTIEPRAVEVSNSNMLLAFPTEELCNMVIKHNRDLLVGLFLRF